MRWHGPLRTYAAAVEGAAQSARSYSASVNPPCCHPRDNAIENGEDDPLQLASLSFRNGVYHIGAIPDLENGTGGSWSRALMRLGKLCPSPPGAKGIHFHFTLDRLPLSPGAYLLGAVDSGLAALVEKQRWLGNSRSGLEWWSAGLSLGNLPNTELIPGGTPAVLPSWAATEMFQLVIDRDNQTDAAIAADLEARLEDVACIEGVSWAARFLWGDRSVCVGDAAGLASSVSWVRRVTAENSAGPGGGNVRWVSWQRGVRELGVAGIRVDIWAGEQPTAHHE